MNRMSIKFIAVSKELVISNPVISSNQFFLTRSKLIEFVGSIINPLTLF